MACSFLEGTSHIETGKTHQLASVTDQANSTQPQPKQVEQLVVVSAADRRRDETILQNTPYARVSQ